MEEKPRVLDKKFWPKRLLEIPEPPKKLWISGKFPDTKIKWLTVVGSRRNTNYGEDVCRTLINKLSNKPVVIVSGLALGIDQIALESALEANLKCVAIPGSGLNKNFLYPPQNLKLANKIIEQDGCLISELSPDEKAALWTFPKRNRIMAGLSHSILIIEGEKKSGTLITAKLASDYNRDVLTIPGNIFSKNSFGPHMLIKLGATPITCSEDLFEALGFDGTLSFSHSNQPISFYDGEQFKNLSNTEKLILENLKEPKSKEDLTKELSIPQKVFNETLSLLEIKGFIKETAGYIRLIH